MKILKIMVCIFAFYSISFANTLIKKDLDKQIISITKGTYEVLEFGKMIKNIKVNDKKFIEVEFTDEELKPLQNIKLFAKEIGFGNLLITFTDLTQMQIDINIKENVNEIINVAKQLAPDLIIKPIHGKIFLEGNVENQKIKDSIINLFKTGNIETKDLLVDMSTVKNPDKMIRLKLYVVEIDNNKAKTFNNDWSITGFDDGKSSLDITPTVDSTISLSGGLAAVANRVGSKFNTGLTLKYLQSKEIANVLDETTLITLEHNKSKFHSGGTINARTSTQDTIQFTQITYGLKMNIEVQEIIDSKYIKLLINTESSTIDTTFSVDEIPGIKNKTVDTNVVVGNLSTIVLGGLININNTENEQKIPILGDIPLLGRLFRSTQESADNKELVFFITPEIVDPKTNDQTDTLNTKISFNKEPENDNSKKKSNVIVQEKDNTTQTEHEKRVKEILGN